MSIVSDDPRLMDVPADISGFTREALAQGWGDGLPLVPPSESAVDEFVAASGFPRDQLLGRLYPSGAQCSVELLAANAIMAGASAEAMPLLAAMVRSVADPAFDLAGLNTTTASAVPAFVVSGRARLDLDIAFREGSLGGAVSAAPAIGRAIRLVMRNVAGQVSGQTSASVFGNPARVAGIVTAEWEEESPWPSLGERRGFDGNSVTAFGVLGTANVIDTLGTDGTEILEVIGRSMGYMGNNNMDKGSSFAHQLVAVNPVWAKKIHASFPRMEDVQERLHASSCIPLDEFPAQMRAILEEKGRRVTDGKVYLTDSPDDISVIVTGGSGNLHAVMFPGMSNLLPVTQGFAG